MSESPSSTRLQSSIQQQNQRIRSFRTLLDPTDLLPGHNTADLYSIRHLCLQGGGIPDAATTSSHGWLRSQAWRVLLGYLSPEKSEWNQTLDKRRAEYYQFTRDFLPQHASTSTLQQGLPGKLSERDALLDQIYRDLSRSKKNAFAFYREEVKPSRSCPLAPTPPTGTRDIEERIPARHVLLERLESINKDFAFALREERRGRQPLHHPNVNNHETPRKAKETHLSVSQSDETAHRSQSPSITVQPASPSNGAITPVSAGSDDDSYFASADEGDQSVYSEPTSSVNKRYIDRRWHSLLRILYIYALLNPSMGYVQGMNEVLFVLYYVMGTSGPLPSRRTSSEGSSNNVQEESQAAEHQRVSSEEVLLAGTEATTSFRFLDDDEDVAASHAEADAFWCFSALVGDMRDLYDFEGMENAGLQIVNRRGLEGDHHHVAGMAATLKKFSLRLKWIDLELWKQMRRHSLDPRLPYFSFRWLACLISTELTLPSVLRVWDAILSEAAGSSSTSSQEASSKIDLLIDICCSLLVNIRGPLLSALRDGDAQDSEDESDSFGRAMNILQHYPDDDVEPIVEMACLYRQRRLAAPLTGDGPSTEDEDDDMLKSMRERATKALRTWSNGRTNSIGANNSPTPSRKQTWLNSSPRTPSTLVGGDIETPTPSRSTSAALLKRYTEAVQSSDAAASLSKASTNFTAKAMASWTSSRIRSTSSTQNSTPSPNVSLADFKASFVNRVRSATSGSTVAEGTPTQHPALRWSIQGIPPDLPLPNASDSPSKEVDISSASSSTRSHASLNRLGAVNAALHNTDMPLSPESNQYNTSTPGTSPILGTNMSKFASPQTTPRGTVRGAGPKPLLLTGSAKPPRERSPTESTNGEDLASRKVSSGPLAAHTSSPQQYNGGRRRRRPTGSRHGGDNTSATSSNAGGESTGNETTEEEVVQVKTDVSTLPLLPSLQAAKANSQSFGSSSATPPLGLMGSGSGTIPASAFSRVKAASSGMATDSDSQSERSRPNFGQVASSANVPLATKATLQRKPQRTNSDQAVSVQSVEPSKSSYRDSLGSVSNYTESLGNDHRLSLLSSPPTTSTEEELIKTLDNEPQRYTLTDEPIITSPNGQMTGSHFIQRNGSSSSNRSSVGLARSKRAYSGGKKTSSRRSLGHLTSTESDSQKEEVGSANESLASRGGSESVRLGTIETGSFGVDFESQKDTNSPPNVLPAKLPSPHTDNEKVVPAEELLQRLQLDNGFSGGESSGFEDEYVALPTRYSRNDPDLQSQQTYRYL